MRCGQCGKRVGSTLHPSWDEFGICPQCLDTHANHDLKWVDDTVFRIEVNPVDLYWDKATQKELLYQSRREAYN